MTKSTEPVPPQQTSIEPPSEDITECGDGDSVKELLLMDNIDESEKEANSDSSESDTEKEERKERGEDRAKSAKGKEREFPQQQTNSETKEAK